MLPRRGDAHSGRAPASLYGLPVVHEDPSRYYGDAPDVGAGAAVAVGEAHSMVSSASDDVDDEFYSDDDAVTEPVITTKSDVAVAVHPLSVVPAQAIPPARVSPVAALVKRFEGRQQHRDEFRQPQPQVSPTRCRSRCSVQ